MAKNEAKEIAKNPESAKTPNVTSTTVQATVTVNPASDPNLTAEERLASLTEQQEASQRT